MSDKMERFRRMYIDECAEHLAILEQTLTAIEHGERGRETVNEAFRAIHSIKGGAAMFEYERIVPYAHEFETVLDGLRLMEVPATAELATAALRATDRLADLIRAASGEMELATGAEDEAIAALVAVAKAAPVQVAVTEAPTSASGPVAHYRIAFYPHADFFEKGNDPLLIFYSLQDLGELLVIADTTAIPPFAELSPSQCHLGWTISLTTGHGISTIREAFAFAEGHCRLSIGLASDEQQATQFKPLVLDAATAKAAPASIRVDVDRIDRLVNLAGEIAISQALVAQQIDQTLYTANPRLFQHLSQLLQHIQTLQDSVMAIRAQPISAIFERMPRLVRELSTETGKPLTLRISGENTEIDKTVIEQLSDPIMHMIRNAADHGIESAGERVASGKSVDGIISLRAEQRGNRIVIEVSDDGRGLDLQRILRAATTRGLVAEGAMPSDEEIADLVFQPGFSTASKVTSLSGRGVGMDVVKRNIQKLGGRVSIRSEPGKGAAMVMTLPLTLAVLEGMIVRSGAESYVVPVSNVIECRSRWAADALDIPGNGTVLRCGTGFARVIRLAALFGNSESAARNEAIAMILEVETGETVALIVDEIVAQQQIVIKSIAENLDPIPGIAGATILGDGRVALIIDAGDVARFGQRRNGARATTESYAQQRLVA